MTRGSGSQFVATRAAVSDRPHTALADAQYWNEEHIDEVIASEHVQVLIALDSGTRESPRPGWAGGRYTWMRYVLASQHGEQLYRKQRSSSYSLTRSTSGVSPGSSEEGEPPCAPSGDY